MDPVQTFLQANALTPPVFAPTSRYFGLPIAQFVQPDGRIVAYVQRRFLPMPENFTVLRTVSVVAGDRLDNLAALHIGDAEQSWRLSDANLAMQPEALVLNVGGTLAITLPEGVPGVASVG
jgi:hypothetical protein